MARKDRNYKQEIAHQQEPEQVKNRMARNRARYAAAKKAGKGNVALGRKILRRKNVEVDHKNLNPRDNRPSNLQTIAQSANRRKQPKHK